MTTRAPDAHLLALERELTGLLVEYGMLHEVWPKAPKALDRYDISRQADETLSRIEGLQAAIAGEKAETLVGAAVKLRRLAAMLDDEDAVSRRLLESALDVVEVKVGMALMLDCRGLHPQTPKR